MDSFCCSKQSFDFKYFYFLPQNETENSITESIQLPFDSNITSREFVFLLMKKHSIPQFLFTDLLQKLETFIENRIDQIKLNKLSKRLEQQDKLIESYRNFWYKMRNNLDEFSSESKLSKYGNFLHEDNFYSMYHEIVHSGILTPQLIQLENHNSEVIRNLILQKDEFLQNLSREQNQNIETILVSGNYSDKEINLINNNSVLLAEKCRKEWNEKIANIRNDQKREFYTWIKNTYEDWIQDNSRPKCVFSTNLYKEDFTDFIIEDEVLMEESYTINLGSQLKTTHNLRLISVDILKFCSKNFTPQRLQTAMSLYSNSLSSIVLLVDKSFTNHSGIRKG